VGRLSGRVALFVLLRQTPFDDHWALSLSESGRNSGLHFDDAEHENLAAHPLLFELESSPH
jgi:hypothetical protein